MRNAAVCLAAAVLVLAGCGVPMQDEPAPIASGEIPSRLQRTARPSSAAPIPSTGRPAVQVSFVRDDKLVTLVREVPTAPADGLTAVVDVLLAGPTDREQAGGITTALPPGLILTIVEVRGSRVVLELSGQTGGRSATENILAVGQIVLSLTAVQSIDQVTFARDGVPVEALLADGALTTAPLTAADYDSLRSR
ncbi:GerMN domain-containing protein [Kribbella sp. NPDC050459]|uniref:GerMN domain-containing protein n=1 Tax=Kribbella sp. NPDC050459 TaxID=3155785 RepID=UPI0033D14B65